MRHEERRRQREDRRLNIFRRQNMTLPSKHDGGEETPDPGEILDFWRSVNNKEVCDGWKDDESIQEILQETREKHGRQRCVWGPFTEAEFDEILRCTAPWKACGVDSVYSFPTKKCPTIRKAAYQLVKKT